MSHFVPNTENMWRFLTSPYKAFEILFRDGKQFRSEGISKLNIREETATSKNLVHFPDGSFKVGHL